MKIASTAVGLLVFIMGCQATTAPTTAGPTSTMAPPGSCVKQCEDQNAQCLKDNKDGKALNCALQREQCIAACPQPPPTSTMAPPGSCVKQCEDQNAQCLKDNKDGKALNCALQREQCIAACPQPPPTTITTKTGAPTQITVSPTMTVRPTGTKTNSPNVVTGAAYNNQPVMALIGLGAVMLI